jgi:hypothetical protein
MYDLAGNPITYDLALLYALLGARLVLEYHSALAAIILNFVRKGAK